MPENVDYREQARRCRRLAAFARPREMKILLDLAAEYDAKAEAQDNGES